MLIILYYYLKNLLIRGEKIKFKHLAISLMLICIVLLSAGSAFAADDGATAVEASDDMAIDEEVLTVTDETNALESVSEDSDNVLADNQNTVTKDNFYNYFDNTGTLLENVTTDELVFQGDFTDVGVGYIMINKPISLIGDDATFNGATFTILSNDVTIDGFTITQSSDVYGIWIVNGLENINIFNNIIDYTAFEGYDSYGIYAQAVSNLKLINNTIIYTGNTDGTVVNNAIRIEGFDDKGNWYEDAMPSSDILVQGNNFTINIPSADVRYDPDTWVGYPWSEGIVFYFCEDLEFVDNRVNIYYDSYTGSSDTLYGVSVRSDAWSYGEIQSSDILIANNTIEAMGHNYMYALYVSADRFEITDNEIISSADYHYANAISIEGPSSSGTVSKNIINVDAPDATYGIYSFQWQGAVEDISYINNTIDVNGYLGAGMEIVECNPEVIGNNITANGNYTYGILASIRDEGTIKGNKINALGSNIGTDYTGDPLMPTNSMAISVKGNSLIEKNTIYSTDIGINVVEKGGIGINNNTITVEANALKDSYAIHVNNASDITIYGNTITYVGMSNGTIVNNAVRIEGDDKKYNPAEHIVFIDNTFDITLPSVDVEYDWTTYEATIYSEGILFYYCDGIQFVDNRVTVDYNSHTSAYGLYDSIYGVSIRGNAYIYYFDDDYELIYPVVTRDAVIANNTIDVTGYGCVYAVSADAEEFEISGNTIISTADAHLAHGIDINGPASNGDVMDNTITVVSPYATYGIYSYEMNGAIEAVNYVNNTIDVTGYSVAAIELAERNPTAVDNTITANGNYTYGIVASVRGDGATILRNKIYSLGSNVGTDATADGYMTKNSVGISIKGNGLIDNNTIESTNIGLTIVEEGGISASGNTFTIEANVPTIDNYGIYAKGVDDLSFTGNTITFVGMSNGTIVNNAVRIEGDDKKYNPAEHIVFIDNTFDITLPSVDVEYDWTTYEATIYSEGILFYYCDGIQFVDNRVTVDYNSHTSAYGLYDSIYGVSIRGNAYIYYFDDDYELIYPVVTRDAVIANNTIDVTGYGCVYAVSADAEEFEISGNTIISTADAHLAHGIDINGPASNGDVMDNTITVVSPYATYGIYSYEMNGAIEAVNYVNNTIDVTGYSVAAIELAERNPTAVDNTITANGNYTYGIVASVRGDGATILRNKIYSLGSNVGTDATADSYMTKNSMGISIKGSALIENNTIESTDIGITLVEEGQITINNNNITVESNTADADNHAIVAKDIEGYVIVSNNTINYVGATAPKENYTAAKAYALYFVNTAVDIADNTIDITLPSLPADWEEVPPGSWNYVRHSYNEGIVLDGCSVVQVFRNNISVNYNGGSYGSIYAVDVLDSNSVFIENNTITATGEYYLYGIIIQSPNFVISNNTIYAISDYYANCIDVEGPSAGAIISNTLDAIAPEDSYPIYAGMNGQPVTLIIKDNDIYGKAYYGVGIEIGGDEAEINGNTIELNGNYTIGIGADVDNLIVNDNTIISNATNTGDIAIWDSMGTDTTGIKSKKGTVNITENFISTTGEYTVYIGDCEGNVNDNYLLAEELVGDESVNFTGLAEVYNNIPITTVLSAKDVVAVYNVSSRLYVTLTDVNGNPISGVKVNLVLDSINKTVKTDAKGRISASTKNLAPGNYTAVASFAGDDIYVASNTTANVFVKDISVLSAKDVVAYYNDSSRLYIYLKDADGNAITGVRVKVVLGNITKSPHTDSNGRITVSTKTLDPGNYTAIITCKGNEIYGPSSTTANVLINKLPTVLKARNVSIVYNDSYKYYVSLKDADGNPLVGVKVNLVLGTINKTVKTDSRGWISASLKNLAPGNYTAVITCEGNEIYGPSNTTANVVVDKIPTVLKARNVSIVYNDSYKYYVSLKDADGNPLVGVKVNLVLGTINKTVKTDSRGWISASLKNLAPGNYTAVVTCAGTEIYAPSNTTANVVVSELS